MPTITPFLWFDHQAEEAMQHYLAIFQDGEVLNVSRSGDAVTSVTFRILNQELMALNAGPLYKFTEAISFFVAVETQAEVDELWEKLTAGGEPGRCGWLKDKFGVSWQIIPTALGEALGNPDPEKARRAMEAMLQMGKIDIQTLKEA